MDVTYEPQQTMRAKQMRARRRTTELVVNGASADKIENAKRDSRFLDAQEEIRKIVAAMPWLTDQGRRLLAGIILHQSSAE